MEGSKEMERLLVLKVMQLTRPSFYHGPPSIECDQRDGFKEAFESLHISPGFPNKVPFTSFDQALTPPQELCDIYLGETFTSFININNDSDQTCTDIRLEIELHTTTKRFSIDSAPGGCSRSELKAGGSMSEVIRHEVVDIGSHNLVCSVSYCNSLNEKMSYQKFFKFHVLRPLDVKTKFHNSDNDHLYLEASITNLTNNPIYLEKVSLAAVKPFTVEPLNTFEGDDNDDDGGDDDDDDIPCGVGNDTDGHLDDSKEGKKTTHSIFHPLFLLNTQDMRQYLYKLSANNKINNNNDDNNNNNNNENNSNSNQVLLTTPFLCKKVFKIGKLEIMWKSHMGERGRLQTSELQNMLPGSGDLNLRVVECAGEVVHGVVEQMLLCVTNCCNSSMDLSLQLHSDHHNGYMWCGISGQQLGSLESGASLLLRLQFLTTTTGLVSISGLHLTDSYRKRTYKQEEFVHVLSVQAAVVMGEEW